MERRIEISDFERGCILKGYEIMHNFINDLEGGEVDEKRLADVHLKLSKLRIGIHKDIYKFIEEFVKEKFEAVVYETESVYPIANQFYREDTETIYLESNEDALKVIGEFFEVKNKLFHELEEFGMSVLYPYLMEE